MLRYAIKLTQSPKDMVRGDVDDGDILELCEVVAYYAYANRIVDGLGVSLEN